MSIPLDLSRPWEEIRSSARSRASSSPAPDSGTAAERLTDDLLVEILSLVPAKSLHRFKSVSKHWLALTNDRNNLKKLPRTLTGFFYQTRNREPFQRPALPFTNLSGSHNLTFLDFLPNRRGRVVLLDCCNGLVLCRWYNDPVQADEFRHVVCNPATEEWAELPDSGHSCTMGCVRLGFDPAVSPHFHVFMLVTDQHGFYLTGVNFYSSETGRWVYKEHGWNGDIKLDCDRRSPTVYLNGHLHFIAFLYLEPTRSLVRYLAVVDTKGESWADIVVPDGPYGGFLKQSQGHLHYAGYDRDADGNVARLLLYVMEDYDSKVWKLSHSVETSSILGGVHVGLCRGFYWIAIHPECNLIFFVARDKTFMCYDMNRRQVKAICDLEDGMPPYLPFVPLYAELRSLHK
uniref:Uncharacterized protein n=1 Tax=Avena sativa TaxID=4498 RepID=A0ACD5ZF01_AVESA